MRPRAYSIPRGFRDLVPSASREEWKGLESANRPRVDSDTKEYHLVRERIFGGIVSRVCPVYCLCRQQGADARTGHSCRQVNGP